jgi:hypothetical protein
MRAWDHLTVEGVPSWIEDKMSTHRPPPPIFALVNPAELAERRPPQAPEWLNVNVTRRKDSGIPELHEFMPRDIRLKSFTERLLPRIIGMAEAEDERQFRRVQNLKSDFILAEFQSRLGGDVGLDVIGPGGRVTVYSGQASVAASVVVRSRLKPIPSQLRPYTELAERISRRISERVPEKAYVRIRAAFGYFELSKYEPQLWLRPAFVFLLRVTFSEGTALAWQDTLVEAATTNSDISSVEGLGSWAG